MLSSFFKFILFNIIFLLTFVVLFLLFIKIILLNEAFYAYSLRNNDTYKNLSRGTKKAVSEFLLSQVTANTDYEKLTLEEKQQINTEIATYTEFINEENVSDFVENNLLNILNYLNRRDNELYIYLPINKWSLPENITSEIPEYLKSERVSAVEILKKTNNNTQENLMILTNLNNTSYLVDVSLIISFLFYLFLIFLYYLLGKKTSRSQSLGKLFSILGVLILIFSWLSYTANNIFMEQLSSKTGWLEILSNTLIPILTKPLIIIFAAYGLVILLLGIFLFNKVGKNQLVSKAKLE